MSSLIFVDTIYIEKYKPPIAFTYLYAYINTQWHDTQHSGATLIECTKKLEAS